MASHLFSILHLKTHCCPCDWRCCFWWIMYFHVFPGLFLDVVICSYPICLSMHQCLTFFFYYRRFIVCLLHSKLYFLFQLFLMAILTRLFVRTSVVTCLAPKKSCWYFYWNYVNFINSLREKWHFYNTESLYHSRVKVFYFFKSAFMIRGILKLSSCRFYTFLLMIFPQYFIVLVTNVNEVF